MRNTKPTDSTEIPDLQAAKDQITLQHPHTLDTVTCDNDGNAPVPYMVLGYQQVKDVPADPVSAK